MFVQLGSPESALKQDLYVIVGFVCARVRVKTENKQMCLNVLKFEAEMSKN